MEPSLGSSFLSVTREQGSAPWRLLGAGGQQGCGWGARHSVPPVGGCSEGWGHLQVEAGPVCPVHHPSFPCWSSGGKPSLLPRAAGSTLGLPPPGGLPRCLVGSHGFPLCCCSPCCLSGDPVAPPDSGLHVSDLTPSSPSSRVTLAKPLSAQPAVRRAAGLWAGPHFPSQLVSRPCPPATPRPTTKHHSSDPPRPGHVPAPASSWAREEV